MLSIITPVYNGKRFVEFCIRNVIEQQCQDSEHIIIDGGSTDGTVDVIKNYAEKYSHIRWISEKDKGQSDAMNKGVEMARGEILGFLNADDYYEPNVLGRIVEIFKSLSEPSLLVGNCNVWGNNGELQWVNKPKNLQLTELLTGEESRNPFPVNPSAYFYHKSLHKKIGLYNVDEHFTMDVDFLLRSVREATVVYVDETLGNFRYISGTKTYNDMNYGEGLLRFYELINKYRKTLSLIKQCEIILKKQFYSGLLSARSLLAGLIMLFKKKF